MSSPPLNFPQPLPLNNYSVNTGFKPDPSAGSQQQPPQIAHYVTPSGSPVTIVGQGPYALVYTDDSPDLSIDGIPPMLVIQLQIPFYAPGNPLWGKAKEDGEGLSFIMYFFITKEGREQLLAQKSASGRLLKVRILGLFFPLEFCS
jgi:hypothetical protein